MARTKQTARCYTAPNTRAQKGKGKGKNNVNIIPSAAEPEEVMIQADVTYSTSFYAHYFASSQLGEVKETFKCGAASYLAPAVTFGPEGQMLTDERKEV